MEEFVRCVSSTRRWGCVHKCSKIYIRRRQTQITASFMKGISSLHWLIKELCLNLMRNVYLTISKNFDPSRHFPRQKNRLCKKQISGLPELNWPRPFGKYPFVVNDTNKTLTSHDIAIFWKWILNQLINILKGKRHRQIHLFLPYLCGWLDLVSRESTIRIRKSSYIIGRVRRSFIFGLCQEKEYFSQSYDFLNKKNYCKCLLSDR